MSPGQNRHLVIMAKAPLMGQVKTRLAKGIGEVAALAFYRNALATVLRQMSGDPRWRLWVAVAPDTAVAAPVWPSGVEKFAQGSGDLGQRMGRVMKCLPPGPAIIVGSDIPGLLPAHIAHAFQLLGSHDAVFGPANDGGYYLVGLKRVPKMPDPFTNVRWSGPEALADTVANLAGQPVAFIEGLADIDTVEDLKAWKSPS